MANTHRNLLTHNYSGTVAGQYVLRTRAGKSIIAGRPKKKKVFTPVVKQTQKEIRKSFRRAVLYATTSMKDPVLKAGYDAVKRDGQTVFNVAFLDAHHGPELDNLRTDEYKGGAGQKIAVEAMDNFKIAKVSFTLLSANGSILEEGEATQDTNGFDWLYTTQVDNPSLPGTIIRVKATDIPKNEDRLEVVL